MFRSLRTMLFAGLTAFAVSGSSGENVRPPAVRFAPAGATPLDGRLSVMTYNIKGLPWPVAMGRERALALIADRLATMRAVGRQPPIVLLQEAFTPQAARIADRAGYAHVATGPSATHPAATAADAADRAFLSRARWDRGERVGKQVGSGLMILSDYPILGVDRLAFPDFACAGFDCLANKGVLIAHLRVPGFDRPVAVVDTHLNARTAAAVPIPRSQRAYARQVTLMARFIADRVPADRPLVLGGDMNIGKDPHRARAFFAGFARAGLAFVDPDLGGARRALVQSACGDAAACRDLAASSRHAKDWLFARGIGDVPMSVAAAHVPFGAEPGGAPLSDHIGYVIDYRPPPPLRLATRRSFGARL